MIWNFSVSHQWEYLWNKEQNNFLVLAFNYFCKTVHLRCLKGYLLANVRPKQKYCCFGKCGDEKNFHPGGRKFIFFNQFSVSIFRRYSLLFFSFFYCILVFLFFFFCFYLFVCFLKLKLRILIHIRLCGRVSDKKNFTR